MNDRSPRSSTLSRIGGFRRSGRALSVPCFRAVSVVCTVRFYFPHFSIRVFPPEMRPNRARYISLLEFKLERNFVAVGRDSLFDDLATEPRLSGGIVGSCSEPAATTDSTASTNTVQRSRSGTRANEGRERGRGDARANIKEIRHIAQLRQGAPLGG